MTHHRPTHLHQPHNPINTTNPVNLTNPPAPSLSLQPTPTPTTAPAAAAHKAGTPATPATPGTDARARQPSADLIRARAYEISKARKNGPGNADSDWAQAETELATALSKTK